MQSLESIKKRIRPIETTSKITNAMKLVATSKIKKQKNIFEATKIFCGDFYDTISNLVYGLDNTFLNIKNKAKNESTLWIVVTSNLGLCGAYNNGVCKTVLSNLKPEDKIIVFGKKGVAYFKSKNHGNKIINKIEIDLTSIKYYNLLPTTYFIIDEYLQNHKYKNVNLVYTKFINSLKFEPTITPIFPLDLVAFKKRTKQTQQVTLIEPNPTSVIKNILPLYISTTLYGGLIESCLCENSSRRNTMDNATKNADELINNLKIIYNRARQENITQEINEIVAGANFEK